MPPSLTHCNKWHTQIWSRERALYVSVQLQSHHHRFLLFCCSVLLAFWVCFFFFLYHSVFCIWRWCIWAMLPGAPVKLERSLQVSSLGRADNTLYHTFEGKVTRELCRPSFKFRATVQTCKICSQRRLRTGTCYIFKNQSSQIVT